MRTEQPTKCFVPTSETEGEVGAVKHVHVPQQFTTERSVACF